MNNPLPRTAFALSAFKAKSGKALAESVPIPGLSGREEDKANAIVAKILDDAESKVEEIYQQEKAYAEMAKVEAERAYESNMARARGPNPGGFQLPPRDQSGLFNPSIILDSSQIEAVESLSGVQYGCLIGAAGTGKTTVQKYLIQRLLYGNEDGDDAKVELIRYGSGAFNVALVAFTGMAVQVIKSNLPEWFQGAAHTIHGILEFSPEEYHNPKTGEKSRIFLPQRHALNKLDVDILIIDEASMVGLDLWKQLLDALKPGTIIIMTGDLNQLPPIIGQPVFAYALSSWHVSELTKVHRQKEAGANRIVEVAHDILNGRVPKLDELQGNPHWRVIGFQLSDKPTKAHQQILGIVNQIRTRKVSPIVDPDEPLIYDPYRDRVMTSGNGYDTNMESALVQQHPLNEALATLIQPPDDEHPRIIIDAGRNHKKFAINLRIMATKNESVATENRVTNGLTGRITLIEPNRQYTGNHNMFGDERDIRAYMQQRMLGGLSVDKNPSSALEFSLEDTDEIEAISTEEEADSSGIASHTVHVRFDNGAIRKYSSKAGVDSLHLAYASTVAKCQGSQFDTAIIIVHAAQTGQLSREWLYTAVTRATKRVILLYTDYGLRKAINKQKIQGKTLAEKVLRYREMCSEAGVDTGYGIRQRVNVPLTIEDYDPSTPTYERIRK